LPRPRGDGPPAAARRLRFASNLEWRRRAACRGSDLGLFFPGRGESAEPARQVCARCPVRQPCLDYAIGHAITHGVWGGLAERERRPLRNLRASTARRERDEAIAAAAAAGYGKAAIGRAFGLTATSVSRALSRDADQGGSRVLAQAGPGGTSDLDRPAGPGLGAR
jgi:WhiB family redox-sensing transcriptional regulator